MLIISSKYATLSSKIIQEVKTRYLTLKEIERDLSAYWWKQKEDIIRRELLYSIKRYQIDYSLFSVFFIIKPTEEVQ